MLAALAAGYSAALFMIDALARYSDQPQASEPGSGTEVIAGIIGLMARWRWYWVPPLYTLALLFPLIVMLTGGASTAHFMYNKF